MCSPKLARSLGLTLGILLALSLRAHAAGTIIFTDDFSGDTGDYGTPSGYTTTSSGPDSAYDNVYLIRPSDPQGYFNGNGASYVALHLQGPDAGNRNVPYPSSESVTLAKTNVGATFLANTTYTLTYLAAPENDPITTGLEADGMMLSSTVVKDAQTGQSDFTAGPSITFDTATDPLVVNQAIGFESTMADPSIGYDNYTGVTDYVLTATTDVPEPSTWAMMFAGLLALAGLKVRRARNR